MHLREVTAAMANCGLALAFAMCDVRGMDKLAAYLRSTGTPQARFAATIGCSQSYLSELVSGAKTPGLGLALRIERATAGAVPASAWLAEDAA